MTKKTFTSGALSLAMVISSVGPIAYANNELHTNVNVKTNTVASASLWGKIAAKLAPDKNNDDENKTTAESRTSFAASVNAVLPGVSSILHKLGIPENPNTPAPNPGPDTTAPIISNISAKSNGPTSVIIKWQTNETTTGAVRYGTLLPITASSTIETSGTLTYDHSAILNGLTAGTAYSYVIVATDTSGNVTVSPTQSVTPRSGPIDHVSPKINGVKVVPGTTSATISWHTNEWSNSEVRYGTTSPLTADSHLVTSAGEQTRHEITLANLSADTTYYYQIRSKDGTGNVAETTTLSFKTKAAATLDTTAPRVIFANSAFVDATGGHLVWITSEPSSAKVWIDTTATVDTSGTPASADASFHYFHNRALSGLSAGTRYYYVISSTDAAGNTSIFTGNWFETDAR